MQHDLGNNENFVPKTIECRWITTDTDVCLEVELRAILAPGFKAAIDEAIVNLLNTTVRDIIKQGSEELGIPVLDPLKIERLDIDLNLDGLQ